MPEEQERDLEYYLADNTFNIRLHQTLEDALYVDSVKVFKLFYELLGLIESGKTLEAIKRINSFNSGGLELFTVYSLRERLRDDRQGIDELPDKALAAALHLLDKEYERLEKLFPPDLFLINSASLDERARAAVAVNQAGNQAVNNLLNKAIKEAEEKHNIELRARQSERERLEREFLPQIQNAVSSPTNTKRNPEFTTNRQVLALCFMLKHLGVKNVDKTVQAKFIEFLIGKTYKDIYDGVREVEDRIYKKDGIDAEYIKDWFQKLDLPDIVKDIDTALDAIKKKREKL